MPLLAFSSVVLPSARCYSLTAFLGSPPGVWQAILWLLLIGLWLLTVPPLRITLISGPLHGGPIAGCYRHMS